MRFVVTGYRFWQSRDAVFRVLDEVIRRSPDDYNFMGVGDCKTGADLFARQWVAGRRFTGHRVFEANWTGLGKKAGPVRNRFMVDTIQPDLVVAFLHPKCHGTVDCRDYALSHGYQVMQVWS